MYIALEWTSVAFRAWLLTPQGSVAQERKSPMGVNAVQAGAFETVLRKELADWLPSAKAVLLSGMITSRTGWVESPFVTVPAGLTDLVGNAVTKRIEGLPPLYFLPGIAQSEPLPDVMRGEEMSIFGIEGPTAARVILPGPHSKWVEVSDGRIVSLATYMSGEILNLLKKDSLVSRLIPGEYVPSPDAFRRGVAMAYERDTVRGGVLRRIFSARSLVLFGQLQPAEITDYLSGLLIGGEIAEALDGVDHPSAIAVMGQTPLANSYRSALQMAGIDSPPIISNAATAFGQLATLYADADKS